MNCIFIMLIGIPASGKSTFANLLTNQFSNINYIGTDLIRKRLYGDEQIDGNIVEVFSKVYEEIQCQIKDNNVIVYEATNVDKDHRLRLISKLKKWGVSLIIGYCFDTPLELCITRNNLRNRVVDIEKIKSLHQCYVKNSPSISEGYNEIIFHNPEINLNESVGLLKNFIKNEYLFN